MIATDNYPAPVFVHHFYGEFPEQLISSRTQNLVPCSDMAGEIVAIGEAVTGWKTGDRICANFTRDHVYGDIDGDISQTTLGGPVQGVLTQYRVLPAHVRSSYDVHTRRPMTYSHSCVSRNIFPMRKPRRSRSSNTALFSFDSR